MNNIYRAVDGKTDSEVNPYDGRVQKEEGLEQLLFKTAIAWTQNDGLQEARQLDSAPGHNGPTCTKWEDIKRRVCNYFWQR